MAHGKAGMLLYYNKINTLHAERGNDRGPSHCIEAHCLASPSTTIDYLVVHVHEQQQRVWNLIALTLRSRPALRQVRSKVLAN